MWWNCYHFDGFYSSSWRTILFVIPMTACAFVISYCSSAWVPFFQHYVCDVQSRLLLNCSAIVPDTRDLLECVSKCSGDENCVGSSTDEIGVCYKHFPCPAINSCGEKEDKHTYTSKHCANGGEYVAYSNACQCYGAWHGPTCEESPSGDNITILRHEGGVNFNRTWTEYRQGFVIDANNLWIGLDAWNAICEAGYATLHIEINFGDFGTLSRLYRNFHLRDESHRFSYTFVTSRRNETGPIASAGYKLGNCLKRHTQEPFSTWDRDNDADTGKNCAAWVGSGYWFDNNCNTECNFFGWVARHNPDAPDHEMMDVKGTARSILFNNMTYIHMYMEKLHI